MIDNLHTDAHNIDMSSHVYFVCVHTHTRHNHVTQQRHSPFTEVGPSLRLCGADGAQDS